MFGIMRPRGCSNSPATKENHRLHYCGTCKAIGNGYGQSARLMLNFDTVFLSEILSMLSTEDTSLWEKSFHSHNCFSMPRAQEEALPRSLRYAAAANVMLAELKIDDNLKDRGGFVWRFLNSFFRRPFRKAESRLDEFGLDVKQIWSLVGEQNQVERSPLQIDACAEPTAKMTALIFERGAISVGRPDAAAAMYEFGYSFGKLAYWLDALMDMKKDAKSGEFNAYNLSNINADEARRQVFALKNETIALLNKLPLESAVLSMYASRLSSNITLKAYMDTPYAQKKQSYKDLIEQRLEHARRFAYQVSDSMSGWRRQMMYHTLALAVFAAPEARQYVVVPEAREQMKLMAIFTALLAALGLMSKARREYLKRQAAPQTLEKSSDAGCDGCGEGCGACCSACGEGCFSTECCQGCGSGSSDGCCDENCCQGCGACCAASAESGACDCLVSCCVNDACCNDSKCCTNDKGDCCCGNEDSACSRSVAIVFIVLLVVGIICIAILAAA